MSTQKVDNLKKCCSVPFRNLSRCRPYGKTIARCVHLLREAKTFDQMPENCIFLKKLTLVTSMMSTTPEKWYHFCRKWYHVNFFSREFLFKISCIKIAQIGQFLTELFEKYNVNVFWDEVIFDCNGPSWRSSLSVVSITRSSAFNSRANDIGEPCKTAELIEMPFWGGLRWCEPKEPCLDGGLDPSMHVLFLSC